MATVYYKDYRITIEPFTIPGGWRARGQLWSLGTDTTHVEPLVLPTHVPFPTEEAAQAYAQTVAQHWVEQRQQSRSAHPGKPGAAPTQDEQRARAMAYGRSHREAKK